VNAISCFASQPRAGAMAFFYLSADNFRFLGTAALNVYETLSDLQPLSSLAGCVTSAATAFGNSMGSIVAFLANAPAAVRQRILGDIHVDARGISSRITSVRTTALTRDPTASAADAQIDAAEMGQVGVEQKA